MNKETHQQFHPHRQELNKEGFSIRLPQACANSVHLEANGIKPKSGFCATVGWANMFGFEYIAVPA